MILASSSRPMMSRARSEEAMRSYEAKFVEGAVARGVFGMLKK